MKCVAKTVSGATAEIDCEPTDTLADLKVGLQQGLHAIDYVTGYCVVAYEWIILWLI